MTAAGTDARGPSPFFATQVDRRFSYCLYAPAARGPLPLVVVVHGTQRMAERYRDAYRGFAEEHGCLVVAPLFPAGADEPGDLSGYKRLAFRGTRYDLVLLAMLDEVALRYPVRTDRFHLHGFFGAGSSCTASRCCTRSGWRRSRSARPGGSPASTPGRRGGPAPRTSRSGSAARSTW
jgi:poly(3-hydroxybutyrate) depolymerase